MSSTGSAVSRAPRPSSLADVLDLILDKGLVVDAYVRISVAGIEVLTVDARVVIASVDTYLRFAEAVNRLDLTNTEQRGIEALTGRSSQNGSSGNGAGGGGSGGEGAGDGGSKRQSQPARSRRQELDRGGAEDGGGGEKGGQQEDEEQEDEEQDDEQEGGRQGGGLIGRLAERARFDR